MNEGEEWVMRPVLRQLCKYESLLDGSVDLADLARMNDALDVQDENERRARKADE
jgi:hypothetical protein